MGLFNSIISWWDSCRDVRLSAIRAFRVIIKANVVISKVILKAENMVLSHLFSRTSLRQSYRTAVPNSLHYIVSFGGYIVPCRDANAGLWLVILWLLLIGEPNRHLDCLQFVINAAPRLLCNCRNYDRVTPLLRGVLRWLPFHIESLLASIQIASSRLGTCAITASRHTHLLRGYDLIDWQTWPSCETDETRFGDGAFSAAGPSYWNSLPSFLHFCSRLL